MENQCNWYNTKKYYCHWILLIYFLTLHQGSHLKPLVKLVTLNSRKFQKHVHRDAFNKVAGESLKHQAY